MNLASSLAAVRRRIDAACAAAGRDAGAVELLAVSKRHPAALVCDALAAGQQAFGENRVQELVAKSRELADVEGLRWHMIGSLQTNKVKDLLRVPRLELLHSLDRMKLADALQHELDRQDRALDALLQLNATGEPSKHGCPPEAAAELACHVRDRCPRIRLTGVMAMGPLAGDPAPTFTKVAALRRDLETGCGLSLPTLSLGMTDDLEIAVAAGSTLVRIGTAVFGPRG
jgi:pyridoxal phosphate enzyme (YggS family)